MQDKYFKTPLMYFQFERCLFVLSQGLKSSEGSSLLLKPNVPEQGRKFYTDPIDRL